MSVVVATAGTRASVANSYELHRAIKNRRRDRRLTQVALARELDCSHRTVVMLESGQWQPRSTKLVSAVAKFLSVTTDAVIAATKQGGR